MSLSNNLIKDFVKVTNKKTNTKKESIVYGKIVIDESSDKKYVKLDGAQNAIPVSRFTAQIDKDQRVIVMIKDHKAIVTGNLEAPSAGEEYVTAVVDEKIESISAITTKEIQSLWSNYNK